MLVIPQRPWKLGTSRRVGSKERREGDGDVERERKEGSSKVLMPEY